MNQITTEQMLDYLEMNRNHHLGDAMDMSLRRPGFEDTPQEQLNNWIAEEEHKAKIVEAIIAKLKEVDSLREQMDEMQDDLAEAESNSVIYAMTPEEFAEWSEYGYSCDRADQLWNISCQRIGMVHLMRELKAVQYNEEMIQGVRDRLANIREGMKARI